MTECGHDLGCVARLFPCYRSVARGLDRSSLAYSLLPEAEAVAVAVAVAVEAEVAAEVRL